MQAFGEAFYGRTTAYDLALTDGHEALAQALCKNVLNGEKIEQARRLAAYAEAAMAALAGQDAAALLSGTVRFRRPSKRTREHEQEWHDRKPDPWRIPIAVAQIPDTGLHRDLKAIRPFVHDRRCRGIARGSLGKCVARM